MTEVDWQRVEKRTGWPDARELVAREIVPRLRDVPVEVLSRKGEFKLPLEGPISVAMVLFGVVFLVAFVLMPGGFFGSLLQLVLFPLLFFGCIAAAIYLSRHRLFAYLERIEARYLARSNALVPIAERARLSYVPSPGGSPSPLQWLARQAWAPEVARRMSEMLDANGGMDEAVAVARQSGVMLSNGLVLGTKETREAHRVRQSSGLQLEDGFAGRAGGVAFNAFEWVEKGDESPDTWHLILVFDLPLNLSGVTQLRTRGTAWPSYLGHRVLQDILLSHSGFAERFRLRADDAVEAHMIFDPAVVERVAALAEGEKVRAVAFGNHLVIDVEGEDRFALVDLQSGEWNEERIARTLVNVAEMKELAMAVADAFYLAARKRHVAE